eukprot:GHVN01086886.1.p1 GENE.GHVN01086886.1~~GHVN01086886.1.p1  ORF type:complete len:409 (+),score=85.39 GHVN01086886.1:395-1621(+)
MSQYVREIIQYDEDHGCTLDECFKNALHDPTRHDLTDSYVVSLDSPGTQDIEDAFHFGELDIKTGTRDVFIHTSHVDALVPPSSSDETHARSRMRSLYLECLPRQNSYLTAGSSQVEWDVGAPTIVRTAMLPSHTRNLARFALDSKRVSLTFRLTVQVATPSRASGEVPPLGTVIRCDFFPSTISLKVALNDDILPPFVTHKSPQRGRNISKASEDDRSVPANRPPSMARHHSQSRKRWVSSKQPRRGFMLHEDVDCETPQTHWLNKSVEADSKNVNWSKVRSVLKDVYEVASVMRSRREALYGVCVEHMKVDGEAQQAWAVSELMTSVSEAIGAHFHRLRVYGSCRGDGGWLRRQRGTPVRVKRSGRVRSRSSNHSRIDRLSTGTDCHDGVSDEEGYRQETKKKGGV